MTGFVLWEGASLWDGAPIAVIATMRSSNSKTGDMVQVWIMRQDMSPVAAVRTGQDESICGLCPRRGDGFAERACYVNVGQAPALVWRTYKSGGYARIVNSAKVARLLAGERVRLGAYGDPAMVPFHLVDRFMRDVDGWTGYTHQWETCDQRWSQYLQASCETSEQCEKAEAAGWRWFLVRRKGDTAPIPGAVLCASERDRNPLQCRDCLMCAGTRRDTVTGAVNIWIEAHGTGAKYV